MFDCYLRLEQLPAEIKSRHKIKLDAKTPRFDVTAQFGYFKPLEYLKNPKGMIILYLQATDGMINSIDRRRADVWLQCKNSVNFSSIYMLDLGTETVIGYGYPPDTKTLKGGKENVFFDNRADGYLFLANKDFSQIEILIIPNGKHIVQGVAKQLADGKLNEILQQFRAEAKPIFQYL
jgi:hypothetical protein